MNQEYQVENRADLAIAVSESPSPPSWEQECTDSLNESGKNCEHLAKQIQSELAVFETELPNIALDADEIATLNALIERYDQVIQELDLLNDQIENLLSEESIKGCDS